MQKVILGLIISFFTVSASAQFVAVTQLTEPIEGICHADEVYALFPMLKGQEEAVCPVTEAEILTRLNAEVQFLKDHPKYKDKGMVGLFINCKGEVVQCEMDNKTKTPELDAQIVAVFSTLGDWKAGKLNGKEVDSNKLYSFKIKAGTITFD